MFGWIIIIIRKNNIEKKITHSFDPPLSLLASLAFVRFGRVIIRLIVCRRRQRRKKRERRRRGEKKKNSMSKGADSSTLTCGGRCISCMCICERREEDEKRKQRCFDESAYFRLLFSSSSSGEHLQTHGYFSLIGSAHTTNVIYQLGLFDKAIKRHITRIFWLIRISFQEKKYPKPIIHSQCTLVIS